MNSSPTICLSPRYNLKKGSGNSIRSRRSNSLINLKNFFYKTNCSSRRYSLIYKLIYIFFMIWDNSHVDYNEPVADVG